MLKIFRITRQLLSTARKRASGWCKFVLMLAFALSSGSAGQVIPARAAPPAQEITNMRFYLNIRYPPTLCIGREASISVTPLADLDGELPSGQKFSYKERIITGIPITAEITDKTIVTVDPAKPQSKQSGYFSGDLWATTPLQNQEKFGGLGEVVFKLTPQKAGTTNLFLTAKVPSQWSGGSNPFGECSKVAKFKGSQT